MAATDRHRHQGIYETVKQHLAYQKGLAPAIGSLNKIIGLTFGQSDFYLYLCTQINHLKINKVHEENY